MKLLDLYCGAGGAAVGYHRAGFDDITGIDINPQPRYPYKFIQADALEYLREHGNEYDVIHASPPCQGYSVITPTGLKDKHPKLIGDVRELLQKIGKPYIIENVAGARQELINPIMLCGTMFNLGSCGAQLQRHRYFECPSIHVLTPPCQHDKSSAIGVYGGGQNSDRRKTIGVYGHTGGRSNRDNHRPFSAGARNEAMDIDWMTQKELSQAIPPAYTEFIGKRIMEAL